MMDILMWFRTNLSKYIPAIKGYINVAKTEAIGASKTYTDEQIAAVSAQFGSVTGVYKGAFATVSAMPSTAKNGDWTILTDDDGANESGIYVKQTGGFVFVSDLQTFQEIRAELLASDAEATAGTSTTKVMTVAQTERKIKSILAAIDLSSKANVGGSATQVFEVADAEAGTKQAVNASQFGDAITTADAQADWDAA